MGRTTRCHRGGEALRAGWTKTFERGIAHSSVALSLSMVAPSSACGEEWDSLHTFPTRILSRTASRPICRTRILCSDAYDGPCQAGRSDVFPVLSGACKRGPLRAVGQFPGCRPCRTINSES
jgi:hypothetical protein